MTVKQYVVALEQLRREDIAQVGGKNASLGEMIGHLTKAGINVPGGFATTVAAYHDFLNQAQLTSKIEALLATTNSQDVQQLARHGQQIRQWILDSPLPEALVSAIKTAYAQLGNGHSALPVAVRSSATAEDLPEASFAGQQETLLNVRGIDALLTATKMVMASLYNDRAIAYRQHHGFKHHTVGLSVGIQRMVRSDLASSGVMFTLDTESGFEPVVLITSSYGLGELLVQGAVNPDEFYVSKPALMAQQQAILRRKLGSKQLKMGYASSGNETVTNVTVPWAEQRQFSLSDSEVHLLARQALLIEQHYQCPMDIEWAKDGLTNELLIVQARPETVNHQQQSQILERYQLQQTGQVKVTGCSIGQKIGQGKVTLIRALNQMHHFNRGEVLVTDMTDPDWEPIMQKAAAIVTNRGGRTCHAAIIAREMGIPAVVGCGDASEQLMPGEAVTVSCAEGDTGKVYAGELKYQVLRQSLTTMPALPFKIMLNVGNPERAFAMQKLPNAGVGLARIEFLINQMIGIHPKACLEYQSLETKLRQQILEKSAGYADPASFYWQKLAEGIATLGAAFASKPVIVRFSDFKSNEYANLLGGHLYEPQEENPMLGFRGVARYLAPSFQACFALECQAIKYVREQMGLRNIQVMVPFVRTVAQAQAVLALMAANGLQRGQQGLKVMMMCELPTNALLAEHYLPYFDGFSIGSNDLTQLTLGLDRDSGLVANQFDERDPAVKILLQQAIKACQDAGKYIGICGQGPSDHLEFAQWLMAQGIDSISLNPDTVIETWLHLAQTP
jgi:pyruvate,water dikinase